MTQDRRQRGKRYEGGRRKKDAVAYRTLITLDADNIRVPLLEYQAHLEKALQGLQAAVYTTHSSTKERPRVRIILPLDRKVTPEEYSPIARKLAEDIGINDMDPTDDTLDDPEMADIRDYISETSRVAKIRTELTRVKISLSK